MAAQEVLTNLFGKRVVQAFVTTPEIGNHGSYRLFFSTVSAGQIPMEAENPEGQPFPPAAEENNRYLPYLLYQIRWNIEVCFYESKTFWSLKDYMLRSHQGIELFVNLIGIIYAAMKILPYQEEAFAHCQKKSAQETRFSISERIREEIILYGFITKLESTINNSVLISLLEKHVFQRFTKTNNL